MRAIHGKSTWFSCFNILLGVNDAEGSYEVGDDHEGEEDEDEVVQVGGQQGEDEASEILWSITICLK